MARRRSRQEKMVAKLRRETETKPKFGQAEESWPRVELKEDLTKTAIVAILALILQAGMYYLLNYRGGWKIISKFWERG